MSPDFERFEIPIEIEELEWVDDFTRVRLFRIMDLQMLAVPNPFYHEDFRLKDGGQGGRK